ncbi:hypothetical protein BJ1_gp34 [Halorubrum virus BJ1]|uniref:Uncharacterized protein n=1 Tax=Halorubrum virus BJ1 TaxID=416419 RepID=A0ZYP7_9CAUD|nr:hypothetical protein BJ1_gp34 [Halorubrum virus BJ1]CAL92456.1 hypothetical protein [Halorubrum virus BJ1]
MSVFTRGIPPPLVLPEDPRKRSCVSNCPLAARPSFWPASGRRRPTVRVVNRTLFADENPRCPPPTTDERRTRR